MPIPVPGTDRWKQDTSVFLKPRNATLLALDKTIEHYNTDMNPDNGLDNLWAIKNAFEYWKGATGSAWEHSDRNARHAMTGLAAALDRPELKNSNYRDENMSQREKNAWEFVMQSRKNTIRSLFYENDHPRPVVFKPFDLTAQLRQDLLNVKAKSQKCLTQKAIKGIRPSLQLDGQVAYMTKDIAFWKGHFTETWVKYVKACFNIENVVFLPDLAKFILGEVEKCVKRHSLARPRQGGS